MNVLEAKAAIGYEFTGTIFSDIRAGRLKLDRKGGITEASVKRRIEARERTRERTIRYNKANPE